MAYIVGLRVKGFAADEINIGCGSEWIAKRYKELRNLVVFPPSGNGGEILRFLRFLNNALLTDAKTALGLDNLDQIGSPIEFDIGFKMASDAESQYRYEATITSDGHVSKEQAYILETKAKNIVRSLVRMGETYSTPFPKENDRGHQPISDTKLAITEAWENDLTGEVLVNLYNALMEYFPFEFTFDPNYSLWQHGLPERYLNRTASNLALATVRYSLSKISFGGREYNPVYNVSTQAAIVSIIHDRKGHQGSTLALDVSQDESYTNAKLLAIYLLMDEISSRSAFLLCHADSEIKSEDYPTLAQLISEGAKNHPDRQIWVFLDDIVTAEAFDTYAVTNGSVSPVQYHCA